VSSSGDLVGVVEACYSLEGGQAAWMRGILEAVAPSLDGGLGVLAHTFELSGDGPARIGELVMGAGNEKFAGEYFAVNSTDTDGLGAPDHLAKIHQLTLGSRWPFGTISDELVGAPEDVVRTALHGFTRFPLPIQDFAAILCRDPDGTGIMVGAPLPAARRPTAAERTRFGSVAAHIGAGLRLRRALAHGGGLTEAVLAPDGSCLHAEAAAQSRSARETLREAAKAIDRARGRLRRSNELEALGIWRGLCSGRWSLVDQFESDGRRFLVARQNAPDVHDPRQLSLRERQVAGFVAMGRSNKFTAYTLGLSPSTIALHLGSAMRKLGCHSRAELAGTLARLGAPETLADGRGER
jgi:DNA-binding CsgD family transcriptional regulator